MASRMITPLVTPTAATVVPPGSKSLTNRALLCAGLAAVLGRCSSSGPRHEEGHFPMAPRAT